MSKVIVKVFYVMGKMLTGELSCLVTGFVLEQRVGAVECSWS